MDPLTHTLVGVNLADARRQRGAAFATWIAAANLPDVDVLSYVAGSDGALGFRRGWTHGPLAMALLPPLLVAVVVAVCRWRGKEASWRTLLPIAYLGTISHPLLDWLNTYGVRLLMPFDGRWFYGDAVFIIDPWVWLVLGGAAFLAHSGKRQLLWRWAVLAMLATALVWAGTEQAPLARGVWLAGLVALVLWRKRRAGRDPSPGMARAALLACGGYALLLYASAEVAEARVGREMGARGIGPVLEVMAGPLPANPFERDVLVQLEDRYLVARARWLREPWLEVVREDLPVADSPLARTALAAPCLQGMATWARFPFFETDPPTAEGTRVHVLDARYTRGRTEGFGGDSVMVGEDLEPLCD